jgi:hypothetical protein
LSDKSIVRAASFSQAVAKVQQGGVSFSTDLDYMTERLWLKLNKGFNSSESIPTSFDVIARTRLVLSAQLGSRVADEYQALQAQQNDERTRMDPETLGYLVADLMNKVRKPEDVTNENLDVEFLSSDDFVSAALAEHANLLAEAESGRKAKSDLHIVKSYMADEVEKNRSKIITYESERDERERVHQSQTARYKRRETNLPVFRGTMRFAKFLMGIYWCVPLIVMSVVIYFMRVAGDSNLSVFSAYWTVLPVLYAILGFFWKRIKQLVKGGVRRYLTSRFRRASKGASSTRRVISSM